MLRKTNTEKIKKLLSGKGVTPPEIIAYDLTDSTNLRAREWALAHPDNRKPVVFIADGQTAGRGRLGRSFHSEAGAGIYITFLLYPDERGSDATRITAYSAVKLAEAVEAVCAVRPEIKWVNDLYSQGKKLAGILAEGVMASDGKLSHLVLGMGINVYKITLPDEISHIAASIEDISGEKVDRDELTAEIICRILGDIEKPDEEKIYKSYKARSNLIGKTVTVTGPHGSYSATAEDICPDYSLLVRKADGTEERLFTGEVSARAQEL